MGIVQIRFFCSENLVVKFPLWTEAASIYHPYGTGFRSIIDTWNMQPDPIQPPNTFIYVPLALGWGVFLLQTLMRWDEPHLHHFLVVHRGVNIPRKLGKLADIEIAKIVSFLNGKMYFLSVFHLFFSQIKMFETNKIVQGN